MADRRATRTKLSSPPPKQPSDGAKRYSICIHTNTLDASDNQKVLNKLLVVSSKIASYISIDSHLRQPLELLLRGATIREALHSLERTSPDNALEQMQDLLTNIDMRNFYEEASTEEYIPDGAILHFYVTNRCNLRCRHCYMSSGAPLPQGEMSTQQRIRALKLFSRIYPNGKVTFTGGEPLTSPDIFDLLAQARRLALTLELYTNGLLINEANVAEIVKAVDLLQISLDGATAKANDAIRGKNTFRRTLHTIRLVDAVAVSNPRFSYRIAMTLTPINRDNIVRNLPSLIKRLNLKGKFGVSIGNSNQLGRAEADKNIFSTVEDAQVAQINIIHHLTRKGIYHLPVFTNNRYSRTCGIGGHITIAADGNIYPCSITEQPPMGNIRDANAEQVMRSVRRYTQTTNVDNVEGCTDCPIRYFCSGGCRITNYKRTGSFTVSPCTDQYWNLQVCNLIRKYESFKISAGLS